MFNNERTNNDFGLVSIIIPSYNHARYVQAAINSAIKQTYQYIELIIVDDGSTDGTLAAIEEMASACRSRFARLEIRHQDNQGICLTLNKLLELVKGKYILRLDSDDMLKPDSVEILHAFLSQNPDYGLAVGDNELIDTDGQRVYWTKNRHNTTDEAEAAFKTFGEYLVHDRFPAGFDSEEFGLYRTFADNNYIPNGYLVRKKLMDAFRFTNSAPREDHFMMLQLSKVCRFKFIKQVLHSYRWHSANTIKKEGGLKGTVLSWMTMRHELALLKESGDEELHAWLSEKLTNWRARTKIKLGSDFEIYRVMDYFDTTKIYMLRLGSRRWPLFELINLRDGDYGNNKWRISRVGGKRSPA